MGRGTRTDGRERGQILVVFTLALIALLGFAGLAIDGGSAFAQRRDQQTAADLAALAAANDYLLNANAATAVDRARTVAAANGFTHGLNGTTVAVGIDTANGFDVSVGVTSPHRNLMVGILGMPTWSVTTIA
jgi:uncharacterized membrane protein